MRVKNATHQALKSHPRSDFGHFKQILRLWSPLQDLNSVQKKKISPKIVSKDEKIDFAGRIFFARPLKSQLNHFWGILRVILDPGISHRLNFLLNPQIAKKLILRNDELSFQPQESPTGQILNAQPLKLLQKHFWGVGSWTTEARFELSPSGPSNCLRINFEGWFGEFLTP